MKTIDMEIPVFRNSNQLAVWVESLDEIQKTKLYMHYYIDNLPSKHMSWVVEKMPKNVGNPSVRNRTKYHIWLDHPHVAAAPCEDWMCKSNFRITDHGDKWERYGFAQRVQTRLTGIYEYVRVHQGKELW